MANWLSKYEQGGLVLKKKTKDNFSLKGNANDSKVSMGPGFVGEGTFNGPMFKNPAWKGQFAMGGSMPGAVGFMYARTQNPAPANGKYTKKTLASAQNGKEMQYYQDGLDFTPKSISKNGKKLTKAQKGKRLQLIDLNKPMYPYISNDQIPSRKQVENKIIKDEEAKQEIAIKKNKDKQGYIRKAEPEESLASRTLNILAHPQTALDYKLKGYDIPDHFERGETATGEGLANIVNPFFYVNEARLAKNDLGDYADQVKEKGFYHANPYTLGSGALHAANVLPVIGEAAPFISKAAKYIPTSSRYVSELEALGHVQTAGINRRAVQTMMGREANAARTFEEVTPQASTQANRVQQFAPYEPPTDAELLAMNEAEANRYFRRPTSQVNVEPARGTQTRGISQEQIDNYINNTLSSDSQATSAAQAAQNDMRSQAAAAGPSENSVVHSNNPTITERVLRNRQDALRRQFGFTDEEIAADEASLRRGEPLRTPGQIRGGGQGTFDLSRNRSQVPMKEWDPKEFRIGEGDEEGIIKMEHPEGHIIKQDITRGSGVDSPTYRNYEVSDKAKGSNYIKVETSQDPGDPFTDVNDISFFNRDPASSSKQMNIVFQHLPTKARIAPINTSIHSQPLLNARMAKLSSGQPGRIEIKPDYIGALNKITREQSGGPLHWYNEVLEQYPKLLKSNKTINEYTGASLQEPFIRYKGSPIPFEEFNTPEMKRLFEDPRTYYDAINNTDVMVNKYKTIKNWKNGGHFIDDMGQWAHPGDITTIPSNDITMRGVDYDVMGISNTGDKKLMKPGKNYKFDGDYVTEYPRGGWLEKYK